MMRIPIFFVVAFTLLLASCGSAPQPSASEAAKTAPIEKPPDEWRRLPRPDFVESKVIDTQLMGKPFMPGGTLGRYKKGNTEYEMFIAQTASVDAATILVVDWKNALTDPKVERSYGGYSGMDAGRPMFIFAKGAWIAGVAGLPREEAAPKASLLLLYLD